MAVGTCAGCAPEPWIRPSFSGSPTPSRIPPGLRTIAGANAVTVAVATQLSTMGDITTEDRSWMRASLACHTAHQTVLCQADPLGGVQTDHSPLEQIITSIEAPADQNTAAASYLTALGDSARAAVAAFDQSASFAETMLIASFLVATWACDQAVRQGWGALGPAPVAGAAVPALITREAQDDPWQVLLDRQRALVYGLEVMSGTTLAAGADTSALDSRLTGAQLERDRTLARMTDRKIVPAPALSSYPMGEDPRSLDNQTTIWAELEMAVVNAQVSVIAASDSHRDEGYADIEPTLTQLRLLGAALPYWPGWI